MTDTDIKTEMQAQDLTISEMLKQVNNAILATSQAQSYRIGSRSVQRADLLALKKLREELMQEQANSRQNDDFIFNASVAVFEGR